MTRFRCASSSTSSSVFLLALSWPSPMIDDHAARLDRFTLNQRATRAGRVDSVIEARAAARLQLTQFSRIFSGSEVVFTATSASVLYVMR